MGGVLEIAREPHVTWVPQGWLFDAAVRGLARHVRDDAPDLAARLAGSEIEDGGGYADLAELAPGEFAALARAAGATLDSTIHAGPAPGAEPSAYRRLVYGLSLLRALLRDDPRAGAASAGEGTLTVNANTTWTAARPVFELALEHLAGVLRPSSRAAAAELLAGREQAAADLRPLEAPAFARLLGATRWMNDRYGPHAVLEARAEDFFKRAHPALADLAGTLRLDPRSRDDE